MKQKVKLKDIASYSKGSQINGTELIENGEFDYLNGGINPSGKWNEANCNADTIAISEGGNSCGYVNYMRKPFWCGAHCYYLYDTVANTKYLYYALKSQQERIMKLRSGACMPNIKKSDLGNFEFIFDDDDKQQKNTTDILNKIERVIELRQKEIFYLDELVKARFIEMFENKEYEKVQLSNICDFITKGTTPQSNQIYDIYKEGLIPYLKVYNLSFTGELLFKEKPQYISKEVHDGKLSRSKVYPNDVLMNIVGPPLGKFSIVTDEFKEWNINQAIAIFRAKEKIIPIFLMYSLMQPYVLTPFLDMAVGVRQLNLSLEQCREIEIMLPPMELQNQFADFVQQVDKSKVTIKKSLKETQTLFDSLMQKYFG